MTSSYFEFRYQQTIMSSKRDDISDDKSNYRVSEKKISRWQAKISKL